MAPIAASLLIILLAPGPVQAGAPKCFGKQPTIIDRGNDNDYVHVIKGTPGNDVILIAKGSANKVLGRGGNDRICDRGGWSRIYGGDGDDRISSGQDDDFASGQNGNDILRGGKGVRDGDNLYGGAGDDIVDGGEGSVDFGFGGRGKDILISHSEADGGGGDDTFDGGVLSFREAPNPLILDMDSGIATAHGTDTFPPENTVGVIGTAFDDEVDGTDKRNTFYGLAGDNVFRGAGGDDYMVGGDGDDTLTGGAGHDTAYGLLGTDTCDAEYEAECEL